MNEHIEFKEEQLQHVIGKMPSYLLRYGAVIIMVILIALFFVGISIKYPLVYSLKGQLVNDSIITLSASNKSLLQNIYNDMQIDIEYNSTNIYQTKIKNITSSMSKEKELWILNICVGPIPDTIYSNGFVYLFGEGSPIILKTKSKNKSILQHIWEQEIQ